jgi:hypothetical protein
MCSLIWCDKGISLLWHFFSKSLTPSSIMRKSKPIIN